MTNDGDIPLVGIPLASDSPINSEDDEPSETSEHASTSFDGSMSGKDQRNLEQLAIADKEERHVKYIRIVTFTFILVSSIAVCSLVYFFAKDYDRNDFEAEVSVQEQNG
jgi:hypothetical protein